MAAKHVAWALAFASLAGCGRRASEEDYLSVFAALPLWSTDSIPLLSVGVASGDPTQELVYVRDAIWLASGILVIADQGAAKVRFYDSSGRSLRGVGREGKGPGEFRSMNGLAVSADTAILYDSENSRVTWLGPDGTLIRTAQVPPEFKVDVPLAGSTERGVFVLVEPRYPAGIGLERNTATLALLGANGTLDTLIQLPGEERWVGRSSIGGIQWSRASYNRRALATAGPGGVYAAVTDSPVVHRYHFDGRLAGEIRWNARPAMFDESAVDSYLRNFEDYPARGRAAVSRRLNSEELPPTLPVFVRFLVSESGYVWIRPFALQAGVAPDWLVFDSAGKPVARGRLPPGTIRLSDERVIVREEDGIGVQRVRVYRVLRGSG